MTDIKIVEEVAACLRGWHWNPSRPPMKEWADALTAYVESVRAQESHSGTVTGWFERDGQKVYTVATASGAVIEMVRADAPKPAASAEVEAWKFVDADGQPEPGLYVAIYKGTTSFPVALLSYGDWEFYDEDGHDDRADDSGVVRGFGWTEETEDSSGGGYVHEREVVAYLPADYQHSADSMKAVRALLARREGGE